MTAVRGHAAPRVRINPVAVDALIGAVAMLLVAWWTLVTPWFTDYELEVAPAMQALMRGELTEALQRLPIYGASLLLEAPAGALGWLLGGDVGMYRAVVVPGAAAMLALATVGARWMRNAGASRWQQLAVVGVIAASPGLQKAWDIGHGEEVLVAALAIGGLLLIEHASAQARRGLLIGGAVLLGLACAGKLWPMVLVPAAIVATRRREDALWVLGVCGAVTVLALGPQLLTRLDYVTANVGAVGGNGVFAKGNLWWFFGALNPHATPELAQAAGGVMDGFRIAPAWVPTVQRPVIFGSGLLLAAAWWWRQHRSQHTRSSAERAASLLLLIAAVAWWRAIADGWYQPYYLTAAIAALALADARRGRLPIAAALVWVTMWLLYGPNDATLDWQPDAVSAVTLAWAVPVGVWTTVRALRSAG